MSGLDVGRPCPECGGTTHCSCAQIGSALCGGGFKVLGDPQLRVLQAAHLGLYTAEVESHEASLSK